MSEPLEAEPEIVDAPESDYDSETEIESDIEVNTAPIPNQENSSIFLVCLDDLPKYYATTREEAERCLEKYRKGLLAELTLKQAGHKFLVDCSEDFVEIWRVNIFCVPYNTLVHTISIEEVSKAKLE